MDIRARRLRAGEVMAGVSAIALLALMLAVPWYGRRTGWQATGNLRWLAVITVSCGLGLTWLQATHRAPALPVTFSVFVTVLGLATVIWLAVKVIIAAPAHEHAGAVLALVCACGITAGGFLSMREEGIAPMDAPADIPTVSPGSGVPS